MSYRVKITLKILKDFVRKTGKRELLRLCWGVVGNKDGEVREVTMEAFESKQSG